MEYLKHFWIVLCGLLKNVTLKLLGGIFISIYSFFFSCEIWTTMLALVFLITFDLFTGVAAAKKCGEVIRSRGVLRTAFKLSVYGLLVSSGHLTDIAIGLSELNWITIETAMIGYLAATELISIIENAGRMGYAVPQRILNQLQEFRGDDCAK